MRSGRLSRLRHSRSSSSAATRRSRCSSRCAASASSAWRALSTASSTRRRFSPRDGARSSTRDPRFSERNSSIASVAHIGRNEHLRRDARRRAVVLEDERLEHGELVLTGDVVEVEPVAVDHLAVAQREDLHRGLVPLDREPDHVDRPHRALLRRLPLREMPDREQPVPVARRLLEALVRGGLLHPLLELAQDRRRVAREEPDDAVDDLAVVLGRDRADAGREAAVDVEVEARDPGVPAGTRALARPELEHAVQHVERLPHLLRVRVRPEVDGPAAVALAREHDPRVLVRDGHRDVRERLVVAQPDVERRPVALDEVLLEVERLGLVPRHDHLDVGDAAHELRRSRAAVALLEVAADARAERLRLAHVDRVPLLVAEDVDARRAR